MTSMSLALRCVCDVLCYVCVLRCVLCVCVKVCVCVMVCVLRCGVICYVRLSNVFYAKSPIKISSNIQKSEGCRM